MEFQYRFSELFNPILRALHHLGGSASVSEIEDFVIDDLQLTEEEVSDIHRGSATKLNYRLRWGRNYLKNYGLLENSERGVWALTSKGLKTSVVNEKEVMKKVREINKKKHKSKKVSANEVSTPGIDENEDNEFTWKRITKHY